MLDQAELAEVAAHFGVAEDQVRRDHMISHVLHALGVLNEPIVFFGGTALARTWLSDPARGGRLSEDIDLYAAGRRDVARRISAELPRLLRREFPGVAWTRSPAEVRAVEPASLVDRTRLAVRIQLLDTREHQELGGWPTETRRIEMRYSDIRPVELRVPTLPSFAAMKTVAWMDRRAARDLYDLAALAELGALSADTARLVRRVAGWTVGPYVFDTLPGFDWTVQLAHQTRHLPAAQSCLDTVRTAYARALGWASRTDRLDDV